MICISELRQTTKKIAFELGRFLAGYTPDKVQIETSEARPIGMWVPEDIKHELDNVNFDGNVKKAIERAGGEDKFIMRVYEKINKHFYSNDGISWYTISHYIQEEVNEQNEAEYLHKVMHVLK